MCCTINFRPMTKKYLVLLLLLCGQFSLGASDSGRVFPSEKTVITDSITHCPITVLTNGKYSNSKPYQTHPTWTHDGKYIIFRSSNRPADKNSQAFALNEKTGQIIQLTDGKGIGTGSLNLSRKEYKLYYLKTSDERKTDLVALDMGALIKDAESGATTGNKNYETVIASLPEGMIESGGFTVDLDETKAYIGIKLRKRGDPAPVREPGGPIPQEPSGIRAIDLRTGEITKVVDTDFTMGHVQASPFTPGEIVYCQETGGDAPQRTWFVRSDGSGNRPLYVETPDEWVTHETWADKDHVYFNVMGHRPVLRKKPTGVFSINVRIDQVQVLGQLDYGSGFWHCNGSTDGKWAVADNFEGEVYLINVRTGERTLLTTGHKMKPDHTHPIFSPDNKRILIQSGLLQNGEGLDLMIIDVP